VIWKCSASVEAPFAFSATPGSWIETSVPAPVGLWMVTEPPRASTLKRLSAGEKGGHAAQRGLLTGQLSQGLARLDIADGHGDQAGELIQAGLGVIRERMPGVDRECAPEPTVDHNGASNLAEVSMDCGDRPVRPSSDSIQIGLVDAGGPTSAKHKGGRTQLVLLPH
jgi:hypothetical protein